MTLSYLRRLSFPKVINSFIVFLVNTFHFLDLGIYKVGFIFL